MNNTNYINSRSYRARRKAERSWAVKVLVGCAVVAILALLGFAGLLDLAATPVSADNPTQIYEGR